MVILAIEAAPMACCVNKVTKCAENLWAARGTLADKLVALIEADAADGVGALVLAPEAAAACPVEVDCTMVAPPPMTGEPVADAF